MEVVVVDVEVNVNQVHIMLAVMPPVIRVKIVGEVVRLVVVEVSH